MKLYTILNELAWLESTFNLVRYFHLPITPTIAKLLHGEQTVTTFHISDVANINNMKKLIGRKKTLSSFSKMDMYTIGTLHGIQTEGGILYQLEGTLMLDAKMDIMSKPDESGRRWIFLSDIQWGNSGPLHTEYVNYIKNIVKKAVPNAYAGDTAISNKDKEKIISTYIEAAEKFVSKHRTKIRNFLVDEHSYSVRDWDEKLVNNIQIKDILYRPYGYKGYKKPGETAPSSEFDYINSRTVENLQKIATGTVYTLTDKSDVEKFIKERGGKVK